MTNNPDALVPSAKEVMQQIALAEAEEAKKQAHAQAEAEAEKKALIEQLRKSSGTSDEEAIRRGLEIINRAIKNRLTEVELIRFPNELCTDKGRAINQQEPGWENTTHRRTEGNLSVLGQVFSAARLQAESTDRGLSRRFAG